MAKESSDDYLLPTKLKQKLFNNERIVDIVSGTDHLVAHSETGKLWVWGFGQVTTLLHSQNNVLQNRNFAHSKFRYQIKIYYHSFKHSDNF